MKSESKPRHETGRLIVDIWTDGGGRNPGLSGWGAILVFPGAVRLVGGGIGDATNNIAETVAVLEAVKLLKTSCFIHLHTDSQYVKYGILRINGKKKLLETNTEYWEKLRMALIARNHYVNVQQTQGHSSDKLNNLADKIAGWCWRNQDSLDVRFENVEGVLRYTPGGK